MKITSIEAIELRLPEQDITDKASAGQNSLVVKIHTDEGLVGVGEIDSHAVSYTHLTLPTNREV